MATNSARFEESTEIVLDTEVEAPQAGWTIGYCSVTRVGALVALHIELSFADAAAAHALTLQADFAPADTVTSADGKFTVASDGQIAYTGDTAAGADATCEVVYQAAQLSP